MRNVQSLCKENFVTIKVHKRRKTKAKNISWNGSMINIMKVLISPKVSYTFNKIPIKLFFLCCYCYHWDRKGEELDKLKVQFFKIK